MLLDAPPLYRRPDLMPGVDHPSRVSDSLLQARLGGSAWPQLQGGGSAPARHPASSEPQEVRPSRGAPARAQILVVDDSALVREALRRVLSRRGYAVTARASAEEALAQLGEDIPDLVLTDVQMGKMSGVELCERLRRLPQWDQVPILVMSGDAAFAQPALEAGADDFLPKPLEPEGVYQRIRALLYV